MQRQRPPADPQARARHGVHRLPGHQAHMAAGQAAAHDAAHREVARQAAARQEAARQAQAREAARLAAARDAARREMVRQAAARQEAARQAQAQEAALRAAARDAAQRQLQRQAAARDAARRELERQAAARDAARRELERQAAARDAARRELERQAAARDAARREIERRAAAHQEAARRGVERPAAARQEAGFREVERQAKAREAARQAAAARNQAVARHEAAAREVVRREAGRQEAIPWEHARMHRRHEPERNFLQYARLAVGAGNVIVHVPIISSSLSKKPSESGNERVNLPLFLAFMKNPRFFWERVETGLEKGAKGYLQVLENAETRWDLVIISPGVSSKFYILAKLSNQISHVRVQEGKYNCCQGDKGVPLGALPLKLKAADYDDAHASAYDEPDAATKVPKVFHPDSYPLSIIAVDTSSGSFDDEENFKKLKQADATVLIIACDKPYTPIVLSNSKISKNSRQFGYNDDLQLPDFVISPSTVGLAPDHETRAELSDEAIKFLRGIFNWFDLDCNGALTQNEMIELFDTAPRSPFAESPYKHDAEKNEL
ncbi:hypothetical protein FEM48_Zijuj07G0086800 [Ziziphus jujuba var. spinosa]|uniref:EF-hand domain-containing protein n=1 Tax=Ziziphus jujuba var. spinosa TaxID=714518 RepID=A0A978V3M1_ZIZJJ|nr:hypothetical protein FEM48_Zijuj07G0086800 [Ziziphus jujuba var. spinosa]